MEMVKDMCACQNGKRNNEFSDEVRIDQYTL